MTNRANSYVAVVDDDDGVCRSLGRLLRASGYQVLAYASAESYLEDTKRPRFDCLVLDVQLGGMSGVELCRRLGAVRDSTPVIFITAHDTPEIQRQAEAAGCVAFFRKTDPGSSVIEAIDRAVGVPMRRT